MEVSEDLGRPVTQPLSCLGAWAKPLLCADLASGPRTAAASGSPLHRSARSWFPSSWLPLEGSAALAMEERGASRGQGCPHDNPEAQEVGLPCTGLAVPDPQPWLKQQMFTASGLWGRRLLC